MATLLIVDDEPPLLQSLTLALKRAGHACVPAETGREALQALTTEPIELAILDVNLPDMSGLDVLRRMRQDLPNVPALVITAYSSVETAVEAMKEGARDYLEKPLDLEELLLVVARELADAQLRSEVEVYRRQDHNKPPVLHGTSSAMQQLRQRIERCAQIPAEDAGQLPTVLIQGETGTGKDLVARAIHHSGPFAARPFLPVNCTGLPRDLVESELFGHERGAFTGASQAKAGLFEVARGGTVFLDEIGHMPLDLQAKLLSAIESKRIRRVGSNHERSIDVRVLAATNRDLEQAVKDGEFRADLYYRLRVLEVHVPPLRERKGDIAILVAEFLRRIASKYGGSQPSVPAEVMQQWLDWHWPGNVRELSHAVEQRVLLGDAAEPVAADSAALCFDVSDSRCTLEHIERELIQHCLAFHHGNVSEVARHLQMTRGALRHRIKKLGVSGATEDPDDS